MGFEPTTPTLATWCSTPELLPHSLRILCLIRRWCTIYIVSLFVHQECSCFFSKLFLSYRPPETLYVLSVTDYQLKLTLCRRHRCKGSPDLTFFSFISIPKESFCPKFDLKTGSGQSPAMTEQAGSKVNFSVSPRLVEIRTMARQKNDPNVVSKKMELASKIKQLRIMKFGDRGGPELARKLGVPVRTWYNYEAGVTIPGEILLSFLQITGICCDELFPLAEECFNPGQPNNPKPLYCSIRNEPDCSLSNSTPSLLSPTDPVRTLIQIMDDCLAPTLPTGTIVAIGKPVKPDRWRYAVDQFVVLWDETLPVIRRLQFRESRFILTHNQDSNDIITLYPLELFSDRIYLISWFRIPQRTDGRSQLATNINSGH